MNTHNCSRCGQPIAEFPGQQTIWGTPGDLCSFCYAQEYDEDDAMRVDMLVKDWSFDED